MSDIRNNHHGFSIIELIIVIVVIGILVAIAIPVYQTVTKNSIDTVLSFNVRSVNNIVAIQVRNYEITAFFSEDNSEETLSKQLEIDLAKEGSIIGSDDNDNKFNVINPVSEKKTIVKQSSLTGLLTPAILITNNDKLNPDSLSVSNGERHSLVGTIVIYLSNSHLPISIYAFDKNGEMLDDSRLDVYQ
ncbi:MAG: prepilin-type N-terminal cleavage/methylation domain-containing protein [Clostridiales bacterium]|nr:prepilin-type N-terminal cleavage/methylation domain-containing protein [Clostridiales bacterium]